jgi:hypothetical protein
MESGFKVLDTKGWFHAHVEQAEFRTVPSSGNKSIKIKFIVDGSDYDGTFVFYDLIIPPFEKAFKQKVDDKGVKYFDINSPTYWMLRVGWAFDVFGCHVDFNNTCDGLALYTDSGKELPLNEQVLSSIANQKIHGSPVVVFLKPDFYQKDGEKKHKVSLEELRKANYEPEGGFVEDEDQGTPASSGNQPEPDFPESPEYDLTEDDEFLLD